MILKRKKFSKLSKLINNTKLVNRTRSKIMSTAKRMNNSKITAPTTPKHLYDDEYELMLSKYGTPKSPNNSDKSIKELKAIGRADRQHEYLSKIYKKNDINSKISRKIKEPSNQNARYKNVTDAYSQARTNVDKELKGSSLKERLKKPKNLEQAISVNKNSNIISSSKSPSKRKYGVPRISESTLSPDGKIAEKIHQQEPKSRAPKQLYNKYIAKNTEEKFAKRISKSKDHKWWRGNDFYQNHTERHVRSTDYK